MKGGGVMTKERYAAMRAWFSARPAALTALRAADRLLPALIYLPYLAMLSALALARDGRFFRAAGVPAAAFILGSAARAALNFPRPYEVYALPPLVEKQTRGNSFPSRHLFSAAVIAAACGWVAPPLGVWVALVTALLAPERVLAGVHFPRDVLAGAALGAAFGRLGFWVPG